MALTTDIKSLLPHREPFLFVDAIVSADEKGAVCEHTFTENEFFFKGHFPEYPVVPGVLLCAIKELFLETVCSFLRLWTK